MFKQGYPDFELFVYKIGTISAKIEVDGLTGKNTDFTLANQAMKDLTVDPNWKKPDGYTWHHHQNCKTMILVPTDIWECTAYRWRL